MRYDASDIKKSKLGISRWAYAAKTQAEYMNALFQLSISHPDTHFVFRPHPSESVVIYNAIFKQSKNVSVESHGSVIPWLLACKLLIHDGCTTAVEGYIAGANIINYQPFYLEELDYIMTNGIGKQCNTADDLYSTVNNVINDGLALNSLASESEQTLSVLHNLKKYREFDSFDMCSKLILECQDEYSRGSDIDYTNKYINSIKTSVFNTSKNTVRPLFRQKYKEYLAYESHFRGFNKNDIKLKLNVIQNMLNKEIDYKYVNKNLIVISG